MNAYGFGPKNHLIPTSDLGLEPSDSNRTKIEDSHMIRFMLLVLLLPLALPQISPDAKDDCCPSALYRVGGGYYRLFEKEVVVLLCDSVGNRFYLISPRIIDSAARCPFSTYDTLVAPSDGRPTRYFRLRLCPKQDATELSSFSSGGRTISVYDGDSLFWSDDAKENEGSISRRTRFYTSPDVWNTFVRIEADVDSLSGGNR
jgi:hypothetical protein